ncbi:MAG TPA: hypothetical protein VFQ35_21210 [Polyangiaceae bacterium]|nr:hypothetical protein [Polyangiaceae bacterium]
MTLRFGLRRWLVIALALLASVAMGPEVVRLVQAKRFLTGLAAAKPASADEALLEAELTLSGPHGPFRARVYRPAGGARAPGIVVAHGVHYQGIDERRLVPFVRALARSGFVVLTPELSELADYRLTWDSVERIRAAVLFLSSRRDWTANERPGLLGFSFAGGLALVAASEASLAGHLSYVVSVGGHHDLTRVLGFLLNDEIMTPSGRVHMRAHDYGLAVVLYGHLEEFVPLAELPLAKNALRAWLHEDQKTARALGAALPQGTESARLFQLLAEHRLQTLGPRLNALVARDRGELDALSPKGKLASIEVPIYLLHGAHDSVIPPSETTFAELEIGARQHAALISPLIEHVEVGPSERLYDKLALLAFMAHLF